MDVQRMIWRRAACVLRVGSASLCLVVGACGGDGTAPAAPAEPDMVVDSIWVAPSRQTIGFLGTGFVVGAAALTGDGEILYGSTLDPDRFSWSSSAPGIATADETTCLRVARCILVTGVGEGTATITATSQGVTGSMTVTVRDRARLGWSVPTGTGGIEGDIAIGADGTIHVVTHVYGPLGGSRLFALSPQGSILWTLDLPRADFQTPAIRADGTLYLSSWSTVGSNPSSLIAVDPGGTVRWVLEDLETIHSSPAIGPDGTIFVAGRRHVYAVDPGGEIRWAYETTVPVFSWSSPAVASDGTIYLGGEDSALYAISPDGSLRWTFDTEGRIRSSPSIGTDGTIYFGSNDGRLYAVLPDGTERWRLELDERGIQSSPSIGADGTVYVSSGSLFAIEPSGSIRWSYPVGSGGSVPTPILGADGAVYLAGGASLLGDVLYAFDRAGSSGGTRPGDSAGGRPRSVSMG